MISKTKLAAADLFCGAGGSTTGAEMSGKVDVLLAVNHWRTAIYTHQNNHPTTRHICAPIDAIDPRHDRSIPHIDLLMASPECTHHSVARGGKPINDQKRATPWNVVQWMEAKQPKWMVVENVKEFEDWGPIDAHGKRIAGKQGTIFMAWVNSIRALGYKLEWRVLNAADYGAHTSRKRLFVIARRGPDDARIPWPRKRLSEEKWKPVHEVIDWSLPCPSVFGRKRPLAEKTLRRIEIGLRKFVGDAAEPFIVHLRGTGTVKSTGAPLPTITAGGFHFGLVKPFVVYMRGDRDGRSVQQPLPTITTVPGLALATPFVSEMAHSQDMRSYGVDRPLNTITTKHTQAVAVPYLIDVNHGDGSCIRDRSYPMTRPMNTITGSKGQAVILPFLTKYHGTGGAERVDQPLSTLTTKPRHGLTLVHLMQQLGITDIGFRMLDIHELSAAQGFPSHYNFTGTKAEQIKQIGNSVAPDVMAAICSAIGSAV